MTLTKSWLQKQITDLEVTRDEIPFGLDEDGNNTLAALKMALAGMEAEPVACIDQANLDYLESGDATVWPETSADAGDVLLYTAPQPLTTSERAELENYRNAQQVVHVDADDNFYSWFGREWADHYQPNQYTTAAKQMLGVMAESAWKAGRRAAMLPANHSVDANEKDKAEPVSNRDELPVTQFKPVADLYGITSPTGSETSFTFDAVEARDFIDGGWSCQEYVELERYQAAMTNQSEQVLDMVNSPVITDGWVMVPEEPTHEMLEAGDEQFGTYDGYRRMLAAAPQQEPE